MRYVDEEERKIAFNKLGDCILDNVYFLRSINSPVDDEMKNFIEETLEEQINLYRSYLEKYQIPENEVPKDLKSLIFGISKEI